MVSKSETGTGFSIGLVDIITACAGDSDPMLVLNEIEDHLCGRYAKTIEQK